MDAVDVLGRSPKLGNRVRYHSRPLGEEWRARLSSPGFKLSATRADILHSVATAVKRVLTLGLETTVAAVQCTWHQAVWLGSRSAIASCSALQARFKKRKSVPVCKETKHEATSSKTEPCRPREFLKKMFSKDNIGIVQKACTNMNSGRVAEL